MAPSQKGTHHPRVCWIKVSYITATINETRTLSQPRTAQPNRTTLTFTRGTNERTNREQVKEKLSIQFNSIQFKSRTSQKLAVCVDQDPAHLFLSLCPGFNKMPFITSIETPAASSKRHAHVMSEALPARKATAGKVKRPSGYLRVCVCFCLPSHLPGFAKCRVAIHQGVPRFPIAKPWLGRLGGGRFWTGGRHPALRWVDGSASKIQCRCSETRGKAVESWA